MKKPLMIALALVATLAIAEEGKKSAKDMTPAEREEFRLRKTGGFIEKTDAVKGLIAIIDTQSLMSPSNIVAAVNQVGDEIKKYNIQIFRKEPGDVVALKKAVNADVAVVIVANDKDPSLLMAPDDHWAVVNVKKCETNLKTPAAKAKFFDTRCRKALLRAFIGACSSVSSGYPGNIACAASVEALDTCEEFVPFDKFIAMDNYLKAAGLRPHYIKTYRAAIREGWAPDPTNEYQKACLEDYKAFEAKKAAAKAAEAAAKKQDK